MVDGNYPHNEARHNATLRDEILVDRIKECLMTLAATMIDHPLDIRTSPSKAVFAKSDLKSEIGVGELRLTPVSRWVTMFNPRKATRPTLGCSAQSHVLMVVQL